MRRLIARIDDAVLGSDQYHLDRFRARLAKSPTLAHAECASSEALSLGLARIAVDRRRAVRPAAFAIIALGGVFGIAYSLYAITSPGNMAFLGIIAAFYVVEIVLLGVIQPRLRESHLVFRLIETIELLDEAERNWADPNVRGRINRRIEKAARAVERMPQQLKLGDRVSLGALHGCAQECAAGLRELKTWVSMPNPVTRTDVAHRLATALEAAARGSWYDLPRRAVADIEAGQRHRRRLAGLVGLLLLGAGLYGFTADDAVTKFGGAVSIAFALPALQAAGLQLGSLVQALDAVGKAKSK